MTKLLLLLLSGAKLGKLFTTGGTMLISLIVYAFVFGWKYAAGFVVLLFVHEMGHYIAAKQRGLAVGAPTFIPFVGAWVELKDLPHDAETEAHVGLGGPLLVALFFWRPSPMLVLMALLAAPQVWKAWKFDPNSEEAKTYYAVPAAKKWEYGLIYLGLAAFLAVMTHDTHTMLESARAVHRG